MRPARGFGHQGPIGARKAAPKAPGDKCRLPSTHPPTIPVPISLAPALRTLRPAERAPINPLHCNRTWSAAEALSQPPIPCRSRASGLPHLQLRAHVPAAAGPEPRTSVVPAAARPSVSALAESAPCSSQGGKGPLAQAEEELGIRGGGALAAPGRAVRVLPGSREAAE